MSFFELHCRSAFSFLASGSIPEDLVRRASGLRLNGIALLDKDTVSGAVRCHFEAKEVGIKAIIGSEITLENRTVLPLIPMSLKGYQNLCRLITTIKLRSKKGEHFATRQDIEKHSGDLICFTGSVDGFLWNSIENNNAQQDLAWLNYVFNKRLYIELQRHYLQKEEYINQSLLGLAHKFHIPYFASNGPYYADQNDRELFDVFTCIKNHRTIYEAGKLLSENSERYLKSKTQMLKLFEDYPEAVEQTNEIASRVNFSLDELAYTFPDFPVPPGETMDSYLRAKAEKGARERYRQSSREIKDQIQGRLDKELAVIKMKRLAGYFLVVCGISDYCKTEKILSQGRGSAANSVVCYSLGITAVDPIEHKLLFERFLSESYEQYPDIDIDLPSGEDREKVIQYVYKKYGERGAGMTANVISYRGKSAVREVGKTFGFDAESLGKLSKLNSHYETFKGDELDRRLKEEGFDPADDIRLRKFSDLYTRILDFPRHLGQHSGGMVISLGRLDGMVPLEPASMENRNIIQWDKDDCERLKIVKVDLLGLGMMAVLRDTITLIGENYGKKLDLYQIPNDDPKVFEALQKADTVGMFQVESRAQIAFLPKSKPKVFYDIVVQVAIIRPGPIVGNMLNTYIKRRQGKEEIDYMHPSLKPILERTLGVPLFQEQLLKIAMDIAGFTGSQAEELRRAMGFKRPDKKIEKISQNLRDGMTKNNIDVKTQETIVTCVKAFANYGFPESHAFSFALLAYASAYFMVHYRAAFMTAMFNNYPLGFYSAATLVKDAQRHGLHFKPVDINKSQYIFVIEDECVRVGLKYVRGLRKEIGERIVAERENDDYSSVEDIVRRVPLINKREVRALSLAGALNFENTIHRREALWQSELAILPKGDLFAETIEEEADTSFIKKMHGLQLIETDLKKTGISIGKHPMAFIREELTQKGILSAKQTSALKKKDIVSVAGAVIIRQRPMTAKRVVFITLEDETGHSNFVVMPDVFERFRAIINQNDFLIIKGIAENGGIIKALFFSPIHKFTAPVESHNFR
ncbi:MAG: DNA polymerase III subunit alpha [Pyrinomonadaceae bacterium]